MTAEVRDTAAHKADTLSMLATPAIDGWVATALVAGAAYPVPLSLAWVDERAVIAVERSSVTARNLTASGSARLGVGPTRGVVMTGYVFLVLRPVRMQAWREANELPGRELRRDGRWLI